MPRKKPDATTTAAPPTEPLDMAASPAPEPAPVGAAEAAAEPAARPPSKTDIITNLLRRPEGATIHELCEATDWQKHSIRGAFAGVLKRRGLAVESQKLDKVRTYRLPPPAPPKPPRKTTDSGKSAR